MTQRTSETPIRFEATPSVVETTTVLRLPGTASRQLPSRGQVAVEGTIEGVAFQTVVEPDGNSGHWIKVPPRLQRDAGIGPGASATVEIRVADSWPEPMLPDDLATAVASAPEKIRELWSEITPMARWEWVRWVNATSNAETRQRRVDVSISKMASGKRRPCCFNLAACTDPEVSRSGKLIDSGNERP